jgi:hypothetical protein
MSKNDPLVPLVASKDSASHIAGIKDLPAWDMIW